MVIYVQQEQQVLPASLLTTAGSNSTEQQFITLVPQVCSSFVLRLISKFPNALCPSVLYSIAV
jgi:hypothetical protein